MAIKVNASGTLTFEDRQFRAALGRGGVTRQKREGDGATPIGRFPLRRLLYRADRLDRPDTGLSCGAISITDGWCDDPEDAAYNRPISQPYPGRHERLWRDDHVYDIIVVLGYNDAPILAGRGSAIFFHLARDDYAPTEGCVAVARADMLEILTRCGPETIMHIDP